ncbi:efflux RND transporter periplasmic adaptor subunit [Serratia ficaria]|uniref:efflux RND transporter periplasmic adaptor subunit n=1 Tax=Serratia ficaria TaxID=61651 RepID=UPI00217CA286|nr:efflux RND transporter periplasmic adaptor subunit [Serratia ficaria]MEE4485440.1 efflux RND transporter periplasmic adaptor subunit [Serratia ficaria]CAI0827229.1 Macrolide-specific efflux protein macA precursor [Serratia ficaria]CAI1070597.1 Macrolide-specific efflux protein macA precursor [Serratia ficaria]CAI1667441.1 Macrolide-specific efflux protein macA precursor [Serratia ficaria]CAI2046185.1 Macrolide-specific efflux protein macA precursor [Serratia ficaria]
MSSSSRPKRYLLPLVIVAAIALFLYFRTQGAADAPRYITAVAQTRDLEQTVLADGTLAAQKQVSVGAQVSGQIKALHVALGDRVRKGQLVAEIDDLTQQNALQDAEAALKNIRAQRASKLATLRNDQLGYRRQRSIVARGVGVPADYDAARAALEATRADIEALDAQTVQAKIAVNTAQVNLGYTKITSPIDGTIVALPVEAGQTVNAVQSAPTLVKVAQLDTMTIEAQISEADVVKVKTGMPVYFTILGEPAKRYRARLRAIEPAPDSINDDTTSSSTSTSSSSSSSSSSTAIYYVGLFDVANPDGALRISMTAQVYIVLSRAKGAVVIPATALRGDEVEVVDEQGNVARRPVKVGINNNVDAQIVSGLLAGEKVIVSRVSAGASSGARRMGPPPMGM